MNFEKIAFPPHGTIRGVPVLRGSRVQAGPGLLCFHGSGQFFRVGVYYGLLRCPVCQEALTRGPVPETHPSFPLLIRPQASPPLLILLSPFFDCTFFSSGSDNFVNSFHAHGLLLQ